MSDLRNQTPADTYKGLLQVGDYTNGVDANSEYIQDGEGTNSVLSISTTKVGVGTVSPSAELDVSGNVVADEYALDQTSTSSSAVAIHAPTTNELAIRTNSTERVRINSDGDCGIGESSPNDRVHIKGDASDDGGDVCLRIHNPNGADGTISSIRFTNTTSPFDHGAIVVTREGSAPDLGFMKFYTNELYQSNDPAMVIDPLSNVGIGTTSPSAPLEVSSTTGGVIMPRMTTTQRTAISSPTPGEMVYDTDLNKFYGYTNTGWVALH